MKITKWVKFCTVFGIALLLMIIFWTFFFGIALIATVLVVLLGIIIWVWHLLKKVKKKII